MRHSPHMFQEAEKRPEGGRKARRCPIIYILTFPKAFVGGYKKTEVGVCAGDLSCHQARQLSEGAFRGGLVRAQRL